MGRKDGNNRENAAHVRREVPSQGTAEAGRNAKGIRLLLQANYSVTTFATTSKGGRLWYCLLLLYWWYKQGIECSLIDSCSMYL